MATRAGPKIEEVTNNNFHSIAILSVDNIDSYYAMDIVEKFQEMGKFFDECIDCINGPYGLLKKSIQIKLGDKIVGNDEKVDLQVLLELLREIYNYSYQGIKYVSRLAALKQKIEKIKHEKVWNTDLQKFEFKNTELATIFKNALSKYGCMYAGGSLTGGSVGLLSVGVGLGLIFGAALVSVANIFSIFGAVIGVTTLGICAGISGVWLYQAVKIGNKRSTTFEKFRELGLKLEETKFKVNLKDFVKTIKNYCEGIMEIVISSPIKPRSKSTNDVLMISHIQPNEQDLLREYVTYYKRKIEELELNTPDMNEENRKLVVLNIVVDRCKEKLKELEYNLEKIDQFINQSLMPEIENL